MARAPVPADSSISTALRTWLNENIVDPNQGSVDPSRVATLESQMTAAQDDITALEDTNVKLWDTGTATLASGTASVSFGTAQPNTSYQILLTGDTAETFTWASKATGGFTINSSNGSSSANVDWFVVR